MRWLVCLVVILAGCGTVKAPGPSTVPLKAITTIHTAGVMYHSTYGRFAASLRELGPPASGADSASAAGLIEGDLAGGDKGGYRFTLTATPGGYAISAAPDRYGVSANRTYFSDQGMRIHVHHGPEPATVNDPLQGETAPPRQSN
jgi:type IV pilus assembly protein PilA